MELEKGLQVHNITVNIRGGPQLSHYFTTVEIFQATNNYLAGVIE